MDKPLLEPFDSAMLTLNDGAEMYWERGMMGGFVPDPAAGPLLVGVYVAPEFRGSRLGLTDALLTAADEGESTRATRR